MVLRALRLVLSLSLSLSLSRARALSSSTALRVPTARDEEVEGQIFAVFL